MFYLSDQINANCFEGKADIVCISAVLGLGLRVTHEEQEAEAGKAHSMSA